jgi:predicted signal transduction protein with EAL and GGDEF domain
VTELNGVADGHEVAASVDERLLRRLRQLFDNAGAELHVPCSIGIAAQPDDAQDIDTPMCRTNAAMHQTKAHGRDTARFYSSDLNECAQRRFKFETNLRLCQARQALSLVYQPRVDAESCRLAGVEALPRWNSAELGAVLPMQFSPIAKERRLIVRIGAGVIAEACHQLGAGRAADVPVPQVSINDSTLQLRNGSLIETVRDALNRHALQPRSVELAIDEFGTGFSSLNCLNRFPIDRAFVRDLFDDPIDLAVTRATIGLGHTLGRKVVAEGVETECEAPDAACFGLRRPAGSSPGHARSTAALVDWIAAARRRRSGFDVMAAPPSEAVVGSG